MRQSDASCRLKRARDVCTAYDAGLCDSQDVEVVVGDALAGLARGAAFAVVGLTAAPLQAPAPAGQALPLPAPLPALAPAGQAPVLQADLLSFALRPQ